MTVKGSQQLLYHNQSALARLHHGDQALRGTKLVIQARMLALFIYRDICCTNQRALDSFRNDLFGTNLLIFAKFVRDFFKQLRRCNIEPILVFEGPTRGYKQSLGSTMKKSRADQGWRKDFDRLIDIRLPGVSNVFELRRKVFTFREIVDDDLSEIVFKNIALIEFGHRVVVSSYECEHDLVVLANEHKCPILLTFDTSIYFCTSIRYGLIFINNPKLFDWFINPQQLEFSKANKPGIRHMMYEHQLLQETFPKLHLETLPIVSALLDTLVEEELIERVCDLMNLDSVEETRIPRLINLLNWLRGKSIQQARQEILQLSDFSHEEKSAINERLDNFIERFNVHGKVPRLFDTLNEYYQDAGVSQFLVNMMETNNLSSVCLDMIYGDIQYRYNVIDDTQLPSAHSVTKRPYSLSLVLLGAGHSKQLHYTYHTREQQKYVPVTLEPLKSIGNFGDLTHLDCKRMIELSLDERRSLLMSCFHLEQVDEETVGSLLAKVINNEDLVREATLCFLLVLRYIPREANFAIDPDFVRALILVFYYRSEGSIDSEPEAKVVRYNFKDKLYRRTMHHITCLQLTYKAYYLASCLLQHPKTNPRVETYFNSTLIFNLTASLKSGDLSFAKIINESRPWRELECGLLSMLECHGSNLHSLRLAQLVLFMIVLVWSCWALSGIS